jgi:hypothetical protein
MSDSDVNQADYNFFVAPRASQIAKLCGYLMSPWNQSQGKVGYNPPPSPTNPNGLGMIEGDHFCGGFLDGFTLFDPNITIGTSLDFLNAQQGVVTNIAGTARALLTATSFVAEVSHTCTTSYAGPYPVKYNGMDRREVLYGKAVDGIRSTLGYAFVPAQDGQRAYDDLKQPPVISMEVPGPIESDPATADLRNRSLWISLQYLKGHGAAAATQQALASILSDWNGTTTVAGTVFKTLDPDGTCRDYGYVLHMLRANELWKTSARALLVAQQVDGAMWTLQNTDGSMRFSRHSTAVGGEEAGMTLVSHDPRVPGWFGYTS